MSRIDQNDAPLPGETETDRVKRYESTLPKGGQVESDPDPTGEEEGGLEPEAPDDEAMEKSGTIIRDDKRGAPLG